jgi:hypothetical protein
MASSSGRALTGGGKMARKSKALVVHFFKGPRFDDHGLDVDVLPDLVAYKTLLVEVAKELWHRKHQDRERLPRNFEESLSLKFFSIGQGSTAIPLMRECEDDQASMWPDDELDEAVVLVAETSQAADRDQPLPERFPKKLLSLFDSYGRCLRNDEWIEQCPAGNHESARYTPAARRILLERAAAAYSDLVDLIGTVTMARIKRPKMVITLDDGHDIEAPFSSDQERLVTTALLEHDTAKIRLRGTAAFNSDGTIDRITRVDMVDRVLSDRRSSNGQQKSIWNAFDNLLRSVPAEQFASLPNDLAEQHDHYVYGTGKRR